MHEKQIENLVSLSAGERYDYFIRSCADFEKVWGLVVGEDNWVIFKDHDGIETFPVWSDSDLANACCFDEHKDMGAKPQSIDLDDFINLCIPDMISDKVYFGVFFNHNREGLSVAGNTLKKDIEDEVSSVWE